MVLVNDRTVVPSPSQWCSDVVCCCRVGGEEVGSDPVWFVEKHVLTQVYREPACTNSYSINLGFFSIEHFGSLFTGCTARGVWYFLVESFPELLRRDELANTQ